MSNRYAHGIMFHHFHLLESDYLPQQGSIDENDLRQMIWFLRQNHYNILDADEFLYKTQKSILSDNDLVFTFDDNLKCQFDIAKQVLDEENIKAFWFINTLTFTGKLDLLEIYRDFRNRCFESVDRFYTAFFMMVQSNIEPNRLKILNNFNFDQFLIDCPFYSDYDKKFKFIRDEVLKKDEYDIIMLDLMRQYGHDIQKSSSYLWMNNTHIKKLACDGHQIGLHSHTHPTMMHLLSPKQQYQEYSQNLQVLNSIISKNIVSMSHPCGNYTDETLDILHSLNIEIGFCDIYQKKTEDKLLIPRKDHANIIMKMRSKK